MQLVACLLNRILFGSWSPAVEKKTKNWQEVLALVKPVGAYCFTALLA